MHADPGTVYLVGAGPGDPDLLTVRGRALLEQADVVVYDRLVAPALLTCVRPEAERIYVGKAPGRHTCPQEEIHTLLIDAARRGRVVVRLKGGDPFVFGRGGEEGLALRAAGIPFVVVPGVTSAVSVPAYAGIPVTHRGVAQAFTVVTGHTCGTDAPDWAALARAGTLVILMGLRRLPEIARTLMAGGRAPDTPVAVIAQGSTPEQIVVEGTLETIAARVADLRPPATIVVGDVVALRHALHWFHPDPPDLATARLAFAPREAPPAPPHAHAPSPIHPETGYAASL